jgi:hypothetical protein
VLTLSASLTTAPDLADTAHYLLPSITLINTDFMGTLERIAPYLPPAKAFNGLFRAQKKAIK